MATNTLGCGKQTFDIRAINLIYDNIMQCVCVCACVRVFELWSVFIILNRKMSN